MNDSQIQKATHTPGPWDFDSYGNMIRQGKTRDWIASTFTTFVGPEAAICNGHLIAAAPELLHELKQLVGLLAGPDTQCDCCGVTNAHDEGCEISYAEAAIARAESGQS